MADRIMLGFIVVLAGAYAYATEQLPSLEIGDPLGPKAFPRLLTVALVITAVVLLLEILRARRTAPAARAAEPGERGATIIVAMVVVWTFLYFLVFEPLGYVIATGLYLVGMMSYFNKGKTIANFATAILFSLGSYTMFTMVLGVNLARGILPF